MCLFGMQKQEAAVDRDRQTDRWTDRQMDEQAKKTDGGTDNNMTDTCLKCR